MEIIGQSMLLCAKYYTIQTQVPGQLKNLSFEMFCDDPTSELGSFTAVRELV